MITAHANVGPGDASTTRRSGAASVVDTLSCFPLWHAFGDCVTWYLVLKSCNRGATPVDAKVREREGRTMGDDARRRPSPAIAVMYPNYLNLF